MAAATILATDPTPICTTTEPGLIGTITDWLIMLMETIGGIGVALAIALESIFPPIP
ncbi:DedA family protein, partial [Escherichia coli]|nr:DedA family protein [Escherichia coli]